VLHWMVCKMEKSGGHEPSLVLGWCDNIASTASYDRFVGVVKNHLRQSDHYLEFLVRF
jgi:hypothetical protein